MTLKEVDAEATKLLSELRNIIPSLVFEPKVTFTLDGTSNYKHLLSALDFGGVYLIEIRNPPNQPFQVWFNVFEPLWADSKYIREWVPNINSKRVKNNY